jgi:hypothetical protein
MTDTVNIPRDVAEGALKVIREHITMAGGCDHDVGICMCDVICTADTLSEHLKCGAECSDATGRGTESALTSGLHRFIEVLTYERDVARAHRDRLVDILTRIHACIAPPEVTDAKGKVWRYVGPEMKDMLQMVSDRIREIPDELAKAAVAATEGK